MSPRQRPLLRLRVAAAAYRFRESLFAPPAAIVAVGMVLAEVSAYLDRTVNTGDTAGWGVQMNSNGATWLLSTVAGATITTAGVVFSLTVVSLQLASSQFSPRVMRSFIRDRFSQTVIGMLVATFVFCVLILRHISGEATDPAPSVSMTTALVLTVATVVLIVAHLNRLAHGLQVGHVVQSIANEAYKVIGDTATAARREEPAPHLSHELDAGEGLTVPAVRDGWISQSLSEHILAALPPSTVARLETRPGAYIHQGEVLMRIWPPPHDAEKVRRRLEATVEISDTRTMQQDIDFALRQLVDVALRALSAAINDPTTAAEVVLRLGSVLRVLLTTESPPLSVRGTEDRVLLRPWILSPDEYIEHAFEQIRQAGPTQLHVANTLARVLRMLIDHVRRADRSEHIHALQHQLDMLVDAVEAQPGLHPDDVRRFQAVAQSATDPAEHRIR